MPVLVPRVRDRDDLLTSVDNEVGTDRWLVPAARVLEVAEYIRADVLNADSNVVGAVFRKVAPEEALENHVHVEHEARERHPPGLDVLAESRAVVDQGDRRQRGPVVARTTI